MNASPTKIVALGGGHGLYATLLAVRQLTTELTAIVTVADDGGSSGRLRQELGVIPPGDLRMALVALTAHSDQGDRWGQLLQHRFTGNGALAGHPVGNLLLAGLTEIYGDPIQALDELGKMVGIQGHILPMCPIGLHIKADVSGLENDPHDIRTVHGQVAVATTCGQVRRVYLLPEDPPATPQAVQAIMDADYVILGPGSWFTSVIPHLLVPDLSQALRTTSAQRILILNLAAEPRETAGFSAERHVQVFVQHAPSFYVDHVIVDANQVSSEQERRQLCQAATALHARVWFADVAKPATALHDPEKLAAVLAHVRDTHTAYPPGS